MRPESVNRQPLTFSKKERICSRLQIENLLQKRKKLFCYPFKCFYDFLPVDDENVVNQIVVSVPKRYFKHAVDRNRIKRLVREAYRHHHHRILDPQTLDKQARLQLLLLYVGTEILPYNLVENKIIEILERLCKVSQQGSNP
ncbi:MAG: ribonuclease P protein component [Bacteroidales bacterium]|nr:ribonuclease P protein component [Bacteroidales bacterium]